MLQAVIFDMDGVLIDSEPYHYFIEGEIYKKLGIDIPEEVRVNFVGLSNKKMWAFIKEKYNLTQNLDELIFFNEEERAKYMASLTNVVPNPGVSELLQILKENNIVLALASSSTKKVIDILTKKANLQQYFQYMVSGDVVKNGKPAPDIFLYTAQLLKTDVKNCIVVEDSTNGMKAARNAGMKCVAYKNKHTRGQDVTLADFVIEDFNKLSFADLKHLVGN